MNMRRTLGNVIAITLGTLVMSGNADASTWSRAFGRSSYDGLTSLTPTNTLSGDMIAAGYTGASGTSFGWTAKLDEAGTIWWQQAFGVAGIETAFLGVRGTADAGCILVGYAGYEALAVRLDENGSVIWQRAYGGSGADWFTSVGLTGDGGFIVGGSTYSFGLDSSGAGWALKLSSTGDIEWQRAFSSSAGGQGINDVMQTSDGRYVVAGYKVGSSPDGWMGRLNASGNILWERTFGGMGQDAIRSFERLVDGSFILVGTTDSYGMGGEDGWLVKVSDSGSLLWSYTLGDSDDQGFDHIGSAGGSSAASEYVITGWWGYDTFVGKIDKDAGWKWEKKYGRASTMDSGHEAANTPDGGFLTVGGTFSGSDGDAWVLKSDAAGNITSACGIAQVISPFRTMPLIPFGPSPSSTETATTAAALSAGLSVLKTSAVDSLICSSGPMISTVTSKTSKPGASASIKGTGFSTKKNGNTVYFGTTKVKVKKGKSKLLKVTIPKGLAGGSTVPVRLVVGGVSSNAYQFDVK